MARFLDRFSKTLAISLMAHRLVSGGRKGSAPATPAPESQPDGPSTPKSPNAGVMALAKTSVSRFMDDDCMTMAAALAYYTTFSIPPLLLIIIAIAGLVFGREAVQHQIVDQIQALIGAGPAQQVGSIVQNAGQQSGKGVLSAVLGVLALLFGATGAFTQLQSSLDRIWRVKPDPQVGGIRNFVGQRVLSLGMILAIAFLLIVSLAVSAALSAFGTFVAGYLPQGFSGPLLQVLAQIGSLAIIAALFAAMFKVLPDAKNGWRHAWTGAIITAILFTVGKYLIGVYLGHSSTASAYGAAGSLVLIVLWIYYSSLIVLFGAEFTVVRTEAKSGAVEPKPGAVKVHVEEVEHRPRAA